MKNKASHAMNPIRAFIPLACIASAAFILHKPPVVKATPSIPSNSTQQLPASKDAGTLEIRLKGTDLYNALAKEVSRDVEKRIEQQNMDNFKTMLAIASSIIAIAAFAGIRSFTDFRKKVTDDMKEYLETTDLIQRVVDKSIKANITSNIDNRLSVVSKELSFYRLSNLASALAVGKGFSNAERDAAFESLQELSDEDNITSRKEFEIVLEKIIDAFFSADLDFQIDDIELMFSGVIEKAPRIVIRLIQHYGTKALGDIGENNDTMKRFHKYVETGKKLRRYEIALPYVMVLEYRNKMEGWERRIDSLFQDLECLDAGEKETFNSVLTTNSNIDEICNTPTGKMMRVVQAFQEFLASYAEKVRSCTIPSPA